MSGAELGGMAKSFFLLLAALLGRLFVWPLVALFPRGGGRVAVIGRQDGLFLDNAKYFFLQATQEFPKVRFVFITERPGEVEMILARGGEALLYPKLSALWFLLRCGAVVVDDVAWFRQGRVLLLAGAEVVQLWHGVGGKRIERDRWANEAGRRIAWLRKLELGVRLAAYRTTGRWPRYHLVAVTSRFYLEEVFKPAFLAKSFVISGYPRNDFGQSLRGWQWLLAWDNVDAQVRDRLPDWRVAKRRLILVVPTFRDSGAPPLQLDMKTLSELDACAAAEGLEFIFKFHPLDSNALAIDGAHLHVCDPGSDVYPLFPEISALITDYSSIASDFLLMDKPVLHLLQQGTGSVPDRDFQFPPADVMAGVVVDNWGQLLFELVAQMQADAHVQTRSILRGRMFDDLPQALAVPAIVSRMQCGETRR